MPVELKAIGRQMIAFLQSQIIREQKRVNRLANGQSRFSEDRGRRGPANGAFFLEKPSVDHLVDASVDIRLAGKSLIFQSVFPFINYVNQGMKEKLK